MMKWFYVVADFSFSEKPKKKIFVRFCKDSELQKMMPNEFWIGEGPSLKINELTPQGEMKRRSDLETNILSSQVEQYIKNLG